ncbi:MAG: efflux RND transporter periplasmic adaptor subunit [Phycisphaerae bacterium]|nr:efflux RND transporter periplasmic adaptor subunit [Phycisphaerae bacterium]
MGLLIAGGAFAATSPIWLPWARPMVSGWIARQGAPSTAQSDEHAGHDHDHAGHSEDSSIELSANALRNVGFEPVTIEPTTYVRTTTVPAMIVERPGRSQIHITAPLTGVVTKIVQIQGSAIEPGSSMFEIRLTHEELVTAQSNLIRTAESLDVVNREISRLQSLGEGVIAGKRILEQEYEKQKLEASFRAERQALLLHGLKENDVESILRDRKLFKTVTVSAPVHGHDSDACREDHLFHVQDLSVKLGQQVEAGQVLSVLADHCELYIEGRAFEDDAARLREAARKGWEVSAALLARDRATDVIDGLKVLYLADHVDPQSRAFRFYLRLPNEVALDQTDSTGSRFLDWRFKPGQRMELRVPVEQWERRIVLPVEAVVDEGAETYIYQQNGDHFDRVPVHVEYRDQRSVVIANDGAVFPGDIVAARGAYQMHLALKNKSGGGVDPHAGHNH